MHMGMPSTITLNYETNMALLHDIIASTSNVGYNKFIMLVAHGADSNKKVLEDFIWHADEAETSANKYGEVCEQLLHLLREVT